MSCRECHVLEVMIEYPVRVEPSGRCTMWIALSSKDETGGVKVRVICDTG